MNVYKRNSILFLLLCFFNQNIESYIFNCTISKEQLASICASSTVANFSVSIEALRSYPISDNLIETVNSFVTDFWQEYEQDTNELAAPKKYVAFNLLAKKNSAMNRYIQQIDEQDTQQKSLMWIIWGYALLVIHYQIVHILV